MSLLEVNKITPQSGTTLTLGDTGDTINFGSGVLPNFENLTVTGDLTVDTNSLKVDSANNRVGIGTASPDRPLKIISTSSSPIIEIQGSKGSGFEFGFGIDSNGGFLQQNGNTNLRAFVNGSERMRITSSGNVGIGTSSPDSKLHIHGPDQATANIDTSSDIVLNVAGTGASANNGGSVVFSAADGAWKFAAIKGLVVDGTNNTRGDLAFSVRNSTTDSTLSEAMRIDSSGRVGIGVTPTGSWQLQVAGSSSNSRVRMQNTTTGFADGDGGSISMEGNDFVLQNSETGVVKVEMGGSERMRIDSSGRVGIGETSMDGLLVIKGDSNSSSMPSIRLKDGADSREAFVSNQSGDLVLATTNSSDDAIDSAIKIYTSQMIFFVDNDTERMRIDSSGNFLYAKTTTDTTTTGVEFRPSGLGYFGRSGGQPIIANRNTNDGTIVEFRKDGTTVGSIGTYIGDLYIGEVGVSNDCFLKFGAGGGSLIAPASSSGADQDDVISLGRSTARFKNAYLSGNIYLGGTGSANALDDYEEGTWTPVIRGGTTTGTGTYGDQQGVYTKVGDLVTATFWITWTAHTGTGSFFVYGLPFAAALGTEINLQPAASYASSFDAGTSATSLIVYPTAASTFFSFRGFVNATNRTVPQIQATGQLGVTATYRVE